MFLSVVVSAHPGSLDSNRGHYNRTTGEYHYHTGEHTESSPSSSYVKNYEEDYEEDEEKPEEAKSTFPLPLFIGAMIGIAILILLLFDKMQDAKEKSNPFGGYRIYNFKTPILYLSVFMILTLSCELSFFLDSLSQRNRLGAWLIFLSLVFGLFLLYRISENMIKSEKASYQTTKIILRFSAIYTIFLFLTLSFIGMNSAESQDAFIRKQTKDSIFYWLIVIFVICHFASFSILDKRFNKKEYNTEGDDIE